MSTQSLSGANPQFGVGLGDQGAAPVQQQQAAAPPGDVMHAAVPVLVNPPQDPSHAPPNIQDVHRSEVLTAQHSSVSSEPLRAAAHELQEEIETLKDDRDQLKKDLGITRNNIKSLKKSIAEVKKLIKKSPNNDELKGRLETFEASLQTLNNQKEDQKDAIKELDKQIAEKKDSSFGKKLWRFLTDDKTILVAGIILSAVGIALAPFTFGATTVLLIPGLYMIYHGASNLMDKDDESVASESSVAAKQGNHVSTQHSHHATPSSHKSKKEEELEEEYSNDGSESVSDEN